MKCHWCNCKLIPNVKNKDSKHLENEYSIDHVIPITFYKRRILNRLTTPKRMVHCCYKCNQKHSRITSDIMQLKDILYAFVSSCTFQTIYQERRCIARLGPHFLEWNY